MMLFWSSLLPIIIQIIHGHGNENGENCEWGTDEHVRRFVRVPEDASVGSVAFKVNVSRPDLLTLRPLKEENFGLLSPLPMDDEQHLHGNVMVVSPLINLSEEEGSSVLKFELFCGDNPVSQQVTVYIDDVNNHRPVFLDNNITIVVDELTPTGLVILSEIRVHDDDKSNTANSEVELFLERQVSFSVDQVDSEVERSDSNTTRTSARNSRKLSGIPLLRKDNVNYFSLTDQKKGQIELIKPLDYDFGPRSFELTVVARDMGQPSLNSSTVIFINVKDNDDRNPKFTFKKYSASVYEHPGTNIERKIMELLKTEPGPIKAYDGDTGVNSPVRYSIIKGEFSSSFSVDSKTGELFLVKHLDRESLKENPIIIHLLASQVDDPGRETSTEVFITVKDVNDHLPSFENDIYAISIVENLPAGFSVVQVSAVDRDIGENAEFVYYVNRNNTPLTVNPTTGWLTVANQSMLDREVSGTFTLQVCTKQTKPFADLLINDVKEGRELELLDEVQKQINGYISLNESLNDQVSPPINTTPATISVQSISPLVRSLPPSALLRERLQIVGNSPTSKGVGSNSGDETIEKPFLSRKENSFGRLLASRRILSQDQRLQGEEIENRTITEQTPHKIVERAVPPRRVNKIVNRVPIHNITYINTEESPCATIRLTLLDANDNNPVFVPSNHYEFIIMDDVKIGKAIGTVKAIDNDSGENGAVRYRLQKQTQEYESNLSSANIFELDERTGILTVRSPMVAGQVTLFVEGSDSPSSPSETRTSLAIVFITIKSYYSFEPQFLGSPYEFWVGADAPIGTSVGQVRVTGTNGRDIVFDMFHTYREAVPFGIEETSGIVAVTKVLQDFPRTEYDLEAYVMASVDSEHEDYFELSTNVTIHVAPPPRSGSPKDITITLSVPENLAGGKVGNILEALVEKGIRIPKDPRLQLVSPDMRELFSLDENGVLYTVSPLDYETKTTYTLVVTSARTSHIFYVHVKVRDLNDNPPRFNTIRYEGTIEENSPRGTKVNVTPLIQVTDLDSYEGSSFNIHLTGNKSQSFVLNHGSNEIVFIGDKLDREEQFTYTLILKVVDDGNLTSTANLTIKIEDINDNAPEFVERSDNFEPRFNMNKETPRGINMPGNVWNVIDRKDNILSIPESIPIGSRITQVSASDKDVSSFGKIEYNIDMQTVFYILPNSSSVSANSNDFIIEGKSGSVIIAQKLKPNTFYLLNVTASDGSGLQSVLTIPVSVFDVNDHPPKFKQSSYSFEIHEGEYVVSEVGVVSAEDRDIGDNGELIYTIALNDNQTVENLPFRIVESSGRILISGTIDREEKDKYEFTVKVEDNGIPSLSDTAKVTVTIEDVNDHAPEFIDYQEMATSADGSFLINPLYRVTIEESAPPGSVITKIQATDQDSLKSGNGLVLYKLQDGSSSLAIDPQDGTIYTISRLDYETEPFLHAKIIAHDLGKPALSATSLVSIEIQDVKDELSVRTFPQELYEVHAFENNKVPERLARIQLNPSITQDKTYHLRLVDSSMLSVINLDPLNGDLLLIRALDREQRDQYKFKIRAVEIHKGRSLQHISYYEPKIRRQNISDDITSILVLPPTTERANVITGEVSAVSFDNFLEAPTSLNISQGGLIVNADEESSNSYARVGDVEALALNEAWVHLMVNDINDNSPVFVSSSVPLVAAVSSNAMFGDNVARVEATDADEGINSIIRYDILPTTLSSRSFSYFAVDAFTGELKVAGDLTDIVGEMVSFDIKATDKKGEKQGRSTTTSAFIHVMEDSSQLVLELNASPTEIHLYVDELQSTLSNISGHEVRVQKVAPHVDGDLVTVQKTDVYIFGVDSLTKELIPSKKLTESLRHRHKKIDSLLPNEISMKGIRSPLPHSTGKFLKSAELAILVGALVVFLACISAIVCLCYRQRKSRRKPMPLPPGLSVTNAGGTIPILPLPYNGHYPAPYTHMSEHSDSSDSIHASQKDIHNHQMLERISRQAPTRTFNRVQEAHTRSGRISTPVTHIDDDNWQWRVRQRHGSNGNITEEDYPRPQTHTCNHASPVPQRSVTRGNHWHIREHTTDAEEPRGAMRVALINANHNHRQHNGNVNGEISRNPENNCCEASSRPPSPDSLERNQPKPSTHSNLITVINHRRVNNRIASDVTEL